ncbi:galactoside alpha-(1,2)-fucosyltransferase 2-like [Gigantopelta aegis]|uniref:galactoside alpha-(1,2)-fucosyltransferase 2-like n=1 Tax=Gigantopelta aegis TaxID=1735272 RepID=UPI001B888A1A|nr:galactoside alpha-(1,2)-fucosyltransferase 2-like [Gigantopelta aegis]
MGDPKSSSIMFRLRRNKRKVISVSLVGCLLIFIYTSRTMFYHTFYGKNLAGLIIPREDYSLVNDRQSKTHTQHFVMITYWGRMGNHMFEYGTLVGVAKQNNMTPIIPPDLDLLQHFKLPARRGNKDMLRMYYTYYEEKPAAYFKAVSKLKPFDAFLEGYYQSWKYFSNVRDELIKDHFVFHDSIQKAAAQFISGIRRERKKANAALVGLHVRRGDFVRQKLKGYSVAPVPYFYKAMDYFRRKYKDVLFIIASNDVFWAEDNLDQGPDIVYSHIEDGAVDFAVLCSCQHMVISAGSYSWWAAYMVPGEVIYYKGYPQPNTKIGNLTVREDYYPPHWLPM